MVDKIKPLLTVAATATGGRNGHTAAADGSVKADLSVAKEMGGPGKPGTTTPEHLFAAGYAACFGGALDFVGKSHKKDASKAKITSNVSIGPRELGGFGSRREDARRRQEHPAGRARSAGEGSARENLPLFARHARQCGCAARGCGGLRFRLSPPRKRGSSRRPLVSGSGPALIRCAPRASFSRFTGEGSLRSIHPAPL